MTAMHYEVTEQYKLVNEQLKCLIEDVDYAITNYANASALLFQSLENINWAGFYFMTPFNRVSLVKSILEYV